MDLFKIDQKLAESVMANLKEKGCSLSLEGVITVIDLVREQFLYQYVDRLVSQVEIILEIDPFLTEREILQSVAKNVVE